MESSLVANGLSLEEVLTWYGMVWYGKAGSDASDYHGGSPGASWTAAPAAGGFAGAQPDNCPA